MSATKKAARTTRTTRRATTRKASSRKATTARRTELEAHLALCPGCDAYLAQMRQTIDALGHVPVETLSAQAQQDLVAAFRHLHPRDQAPG